MPAQPELLGAAVEHVLEVRQGLKAQESSQLMWAFAALGQRHDRLFGALRPLLLRQRLKTKEIASVLWAHATLDVHDLQVGGMFGRAGGWQSR
jgi:hypothetical protein